MSTIETLDGDAKKESSVFLVLPSPKKKHKRKKENRKRNQKGQLAPHIYIYYEQTSSMNICVHKSYYVSNLGCLFYLSLSLSLSLSLPLSPNLLPRHLSLLLCGCAQET